METYPWDYYGVCVNESDIPDKCIKSYDPNTRELQTVTCGSDIDRWGFS